jgi:tetratricopeptide (TPR) repeat protein
MTDFNLQQNIISECKRLDACGTSQESIDLLGRALSKTPDAALFYERGIRFEQIGDNERALADYSEGIRLEPLLKLLVARGVLLCDRLGAESGLSDLRSAVELFPQSAEAHMRMCLCNSLIGRNDDAFKHAHIWTSLEPNAATSHYYLGLCLKAEKQFEEAAKELRIAASLDPSSAITWSGLAAALRKIGNLPEAKECFQKSIEIEDSAFTRIELASLLRDLHEPEQAIEQLESAKTFTLTEGETLLVESYSELARQESEKRKQQ